MTVASYKRLTILLSVAVLLLLCAGNLFWNYGRLRLEVAFAKEQTEIFAEMRKKALQADSAGAVGFLEYAVCYYPSGTKQRTGSRLDAIVEQERIRCVTDILSHLRAKTGEDLGDDPQKWIDHYIRNKN